jgi:hypothetical protein
MQINFIEIENEMSDLSRLYMVYGEEEFTFEEANSIITFSPYLMAFYKDKEWMEHVLHEGEPSTWKITYMGARMTEIYMELKSEGNKFTKNRHREQQTLL